MAITPIEVATMAPKSQVIAPVHQHNVQKPVHDQLQFSQQFNQEIKQNSKQTVKTIKSENNEYRYDAKEKGNNSDNYKYSGKKKKAKEQEKGKASSPHKGGIDIRI